MSVLSTIKKPDDRPAIVTILGDSGLGKTSLACTFPKAIVIRAEDGLSAIPAEQRPDAFPVIQKVDDVWDQLMALIKEDHEYKTDRKSTRLNSSHVANSYAVFCLK